MNNRGQFSFGLVGYALTGAILLMVFLMTYQPILDALLPSIENVPNYPVIALLLGLVGLVLVALFISSLWQNSQWQSGGRQ